MSSRPFIFQAAQFRAELHAAELIHERIKDCDVSFANGNRKQIRNTIMALENHLLGEDIATPEFLERLKGIEEAWKKKYDEKYAKYKEECEDAGCPDVIEPPSKMPDIDFFREKYIAMKVLISHKGMWLKESQVVDKK